MSVQTLYFEQEPGEFVRAARFSGVLCLAAFSTASLSLPLTASWRTFFCFSADFLDLSVLSRSPASIASLWHVLVSEHLSGHGLTWSKSHTSKHGLETTRWMPAAFASACASLTLLNLSTSTITQTTS